MYICAPILVFCRVHDSFMQWVSPALLAHIVHVNSEQLSSPPFYRVDVEAAGVAWGLGYRRLLVCCSSSFEVHREGPLFIREVCCLRCLRGISARECRKNTKNYEDD
ncbi:unnamed protein product [Ectocarpus sp. 12 AP-2014]